MGQVRRKRSKKVRPDRAGVPDELDPAPATAVSGEVWDCVQAGADVRVPSHVADLELRECRWIDADLSSRQFTGLRCRDTEFVHCDLSGAVLDEAVLRRVTFTDCRLTGIGLSGAELVDVRISDSRADIARFRMARGTYLWVENTSLRAADFYEFTGVDCALLGCDLVEATLHEARFDGLQLHGSTIDDVDGALSLRGARISRDQLIPLGAALLAALDIEVSDPPAG